MTRRRGVVAVSTAVATACLCGILPSPQAAQAVTHTWVGASGSTGTPRSGSWSTPPNWSNNLVPASAQNLILTFGGSQSYTSTNDLPATLTLNKLSLGGNAFNTIILNGNPLEFVVDKTVQADPPAINVYPGLFDIANHMTLTGSLRLNGSAGTVTLAGTLAGPGGVNALATANFVLAGPNTYAGGTSVSGRLTVAGAGTLGSGTVTVSNRGGLTLASPANVTSGNGSVTVNNGGFVQFGSLTDAALPLLNPSSAGVIGIGADESAPLDFSNHPLLRLGANVRGGGYTGGTVTYSGALTPANHTYRFGGQFDTTFAAAFTAGTLAVASHLTDAPGGTPRSVDIGSNAMSVGGRVSLTNPANAFSGGVTVTKDSPIATALLISSTAAPGQTPLGTGPVTVFDTLLFAGPDGALGALPNALILKPGSTLAFDNDLAPGTPVPNRWPDARPLTLDGATVRLQGNASLNSTERLGPTTVAGNSNASINRMGSPVTTALEFSSLHRAARGTLEIRSANGSTSFGTDNLFKITDPATVTSPLTGMVAPWVIGNINTIGDYPTGEFLRVLPDGAFAPFIYAPGFDAASANEVPAITTANAKSITADESVWALRTQDNVGASLVSVGSGVTLTIKSGGLILNGTSVTGSNGTISFPAEALIYTGGNDAAISARIAGSAGLTKFGSRMLTLSGNNTLTGGVAVNNGTLKVNHAGALNAANPNPLTVDQLGTVDLNGYPVTVPSLAGSGTITNRTGGWTTGIALTVDTASADSTFSGTLTDTPGQGVLALTKSGTATLTLAGANAYSGDTTLLAGTLVVAVTKPNTFGGNNRYLTSAGTHLRFTGPQHVGTITGQGDLSLSSTLLTATSVQQSSLTLTNSATLRLRSASTPTNSTLSSLSIDPTSTLDLTNNTLTLLGASHENAALVRQYLRDARLTSSAPDPQDLLSLGYRPTSPTTLLVHLTYTGDANMDGVVDADDYLLLDRGLALSLTDWRDGDFDYSGSVTPTDYLLIDRTFVLQGNPLSPEFLAARESQFGPGYAAALLTSIPEPTLLGVCPFAMLFVRIPRRRHAP